ncbi:N-acetylneuraminate synthase [Anaeroarcus burkinensis]|uniref:N-acetylneuraminate synthase n=1 Tax=Anaeroarcus burkinensis TaxID=82376 RepID=UPI0004292AA6|nr:N-acetylneuraminate synthase [Anaeroarcus burkinensis]
MGRTYIIGEAGVNHNGSIEMAKQLVDAAAESGVDAVKFQSFNADLMVSRQAPKAEYQHRNTQVQESQYEMLKRLELSREMHLELLAYCKEKGIEFLSTPFDTESLEMLVRDCDVAQIKIPSGEITNAPLLLSIAKTGKNVILSTGMSNLGDIEIALGVLAYGYMGKNGKPTMETFLEAYHSEDGRAILQSKVVLLHCTTEYPASPEDVNLCSMETLEKAFGLPVGFSDHTQGMAIAFAAVAKGASLVEKHFTLSRNLPGPDHKASLEPAELKMMVTGIRKVELALGKTMKVPVASELKNKAIARKSLVAAKDIRQGEKYTNENIAIKRPGDGVSPIYYWDWIGKMSDRDYKKDEKIR